MREAHSKPIQQAKIDTGRIKFPILAPLFIAISLLLVTFTVAIYHLEQRNIADNVRMLLGSTHRYYKQCLASDAHILDATTNLIRNDPAIQSAWLTRDRDRLIGYTAPLLEKLKDEYRVTHIYFIDTDRTCFLRVHNPLRYGDQIDRFTLRIASRDLKSFWGVELGPYGTFTLRMVHPWFINDKLVGYIELGEEIEHIIPQIKEALDVDLAVLINKALLRRQMWEEGLKMMGRSGNWELIPNRVVADSTIASIPPELIKIGGLDHIQQSDRVFKAELNSLPYRAGFVRLRDAKGHEVGYILVIKNVSKDQASLHTLLAVVTALCLFVAAMLVSFFYVHIANIEKRLMEAHGNLETEIEKRKEAESELRRHRDRLEEVVNARTAELESTNRNLQLEVEYRTKAEKSLEKAKADLEFTIVQLIQTNRKLREFAHLAAHDLKTPLRGIGTLAQWLADDYGDKFDDKGHQKIELLVRRVKRIDKLMDAILDYSTIARDMRQEHPVDFNLVIRSVLAEIEPPQNVQVTVNRNLPTLICEERHVRQVIYNLVDNAVKFMDKPDGRITIDCTEKDLLWEFSVLDNGPGIDRQHFEKIFSLFQTLGTRDEVEEAGVGLTLARKIVELYGGKIWLQSQVGQGTTFSFTLPKRPSEVTAKKLQPVTS